MGRGGGAVALIDWSTVFEGGATTGGSISLNCESKDWKRVGGHSSLSGFYTLLWLIPRA